MLITCYRCDRAIRRRCDSVRARRPLERAEKAIAKDPSNGPGAGGRRVGAGMLGDDRAGTRLDRSRSAARSGQYSRCATIWLARSPATSSDPERALEVLRPLFRARDQPDHHQAPRGRSRSRHNPRRPAVQENVVGRQGAPRNRTLRMAGRRHARPPRIRASYLTCSRPRPAGRAGSGSRSRSAPAPCRQVGAEPSSTVTTSRLLLSPVSGHWI